MAKGKNTTAIVYDLAKPITDDLGLILWDVVFEKEGANWYLRVIIDKEDGVSTDDCEAVSRRLDPLLDDADPIEQSYYLSVSSPGLERALTKDWHFEACMGQPVRVRLFRAQNGQKELVGVLCAHDPQSGAVTIETEDEQMVTINKSDAGSIRLYCAF